MVEQQLYTNIEALVLQYLIKKQVPFQFQTSLSGGFYELGGAVVDFILTEHQIALRIHGEYWHSGVEKTGSDIIQKETLSNMGYTVVDLWSTDLENRLEETMRLALEGREILR